MKKTIKSIIAVLLSVLTGVLVSVQAFAASTTKKYISEITLCYASSYEQAKAELEAGGFKIADKTNLNATLGQGVYLGCKYTSDPSEAITDIAAMNMNGAYSYTDYKTILEQNRESVDGWIEGLIGVIEEYRLNYDAGEIVAVNVHDYLNRIIEDESGTPMGDFLLECSINSGHHSELTDAFMKGNSSIIACIEQALILACDNESTTWIERLEGSSYDELEDRYLLAYKTVNKAEKAMDAKYGDTADSIFSDWNNFYNSIQDIENSLSYNEDGAKYDDFDFTDTDEELSEESETVLQTLTDITAFNDISLYIKLAETKYEDGSLLDFFNRPAYEVEREELYPMCDALSKGQAAEVMLSGIRQLVMSALVEKSDIRENNKLNFDDMLEGITEISLYDGVDLETFENGVAMTSDATKHESSSTDHWYNAFLNPENNTQRWGAYFMFYIVPTVIFTGGFLASAYIAHASHEAALAARAAIEGTVIKKTTDELAKETVKKIELIATDTYDAAVAKLPLSDRANMIVETFFYQRTGETVFNFICKTTFFILTLVMLVVDIVMLVKTIMASVSDPDYEDIPHHILDATSARGSVDYVMYKAARTTKGQAADLNAYESHDGWLVLYTTKEPEAGKPITSDMTIHTGSNATPSGYSNVHLFGTKEALNVTDSDYTDESDSTGGTYMFFKRSSASLSGTAVTNGTAIIIIGLCLFAGVITGILAGRKSKVSKTSRVKEAV